MTCVEKNLSLCPGGDYIEMPCFSHERSKGIKIKSDVLMWGVREARNRQCRKRLKVDDFQHFEGFSDE